MDRTLTLVLPPQQGLLEGFSSGLVALANYISLHEPSVDVRLLDLSVTSGHKLEAEVSSALKEATEDHFVGITTTTASYQAALKTARIFKALAPSCVVVMGGHHASPQDAVVLGHGQVDLVVRGEGERALLELLRRYPDLKEVPNLSYRDGTSIRRTPLAPLLEQEELDGLRPVFRGLRRRSAPGKFDHATYVSARGCPLQCAFCSVANERIRAKRAPAIVDDLRYLVGVLGYRSIAIEDNFFAHSPKRTLEVCEALEALRREMDFTWDCQTRVESMRRPEILRAMERAGCEAVYLGVESFDPEQLLYLRKTPSPGRYVRALTEDVVPSILESSIDCYVNIQLGLPGEGQSHRRANLNGLQALGKEAASRGRTITVFPQLHVVYPGTRHFEEALVEGRFGPHADDVFERFTEWEARQQPILTWLGEHFAHGCGGIPEGILDRSRLGSGDFEMNGDAVLGVVNYLSEIEETQGLTVFRYGSYLTRDEDPETRPTPLQEESHA